MFEPWAFTADGDSCPPVRNRGAVDGQVYRRTVIRMCAFKGIDVERATEDLKNRTLAKLPGDIARLIYLAGTREYNTGRYHHDGLAFHFTPEAARKALAVCHQEIFDRVALSPLEELVLSIDPRKAG